MLELDFDQRKEEWKAQGFNVDTRTRLEDLPRDAVPGTIRFVAYDDEVFSFMLTDRGFWSRLDEPIDRLLSEGWVRHGRYVHGRYGRKGVMSSGNYKDIKTPRKSGRE